jgi:hypothetical protein
MTPLRLADELLTTDELVIELEAVGYLAAAQALERGTASPEYEIFNGERAYRLGKSLAWAAGRSPELIAA